MYPYPYINEYPSLAEWADGLTDDLASKFTQIAADACYRESGERWSLDLRAEFTKEVSTALVGKWLCAQIGELFSFLSFTTLEDAFFMRQIENNKKQIEEWGEQWLENKMGEFELADFKRMLEDGA